MNKTREDRVREMFLDWKPSYIVEIDGKMVEAIWVARAVPDARAGSHAMLKDEVHQFQLADGSQVWVKNPVCFKIERYTDASTAKWINA